MAANAAGSFDAEVRSTQAWMASPRFEGVMRLYSARQVVEQRGAINQDHTVARLAAERFYTRLRELFQAGECISTFGPYSPGQAVAMRRAGIEGIYLGGWATSAKGSLHEDPGPDLASYPLSMVPDEAAGMVRALLTADRNQRFARSRMSIAERQTTPEVDFTPAIIADADTGHGGDAHVRNLIRRFVEAGVPGYHIEDQKPGVKKCGHQGGKVLVPCDEQIKRLNAARFQLDVMGVPGIIVARTDAEAANLLDGGADERDQPFIMGATQQSVPSYKDAYLAVLRRLAEAGVDGVNGHLLYAVPENRIKRAMAWLDQTGVNQIIEKAAVTYHASPDPRADDAVDQASDALAEAWHRTSGLATYAQAVADQLALRSSEGESFAMDTGEWLRFARSTDADTAREKATEMGLDVAWDSEVARTTEGYYQVQGGIPYAVAKSLAVAPFCDLLWMETKTADLDDAREFAEAVHAVHPGQDAGLQPVAVVQLGHHRHERQRDARVPRRTGPVGVRVQLHHLRRPSNRRHGRRGVRRLPPTRRDAGLGPAPAAVPPGRFPLQDAPDPGGRPPLGRRTHGQLGAHRHHSGHGQGLDTVPAPGADRGAHPRA